MGGGGGYSTWSMNNVVAGAVFGGGSARETAGWREPWLQSRRTKYLRDESTQVERSNVRIGP